MPTGHSLSSGFGTSDDAQNIDMVYRGTFHEYYSVICLIDEEEEKEEEENGDEDVSIQAKKSFSNSSSATAENFAMTTLFLRPIHVCNDLHRGIIACPMLIPSATCFLAWRRR